MSAKPANPSPFEKLEAQSSLYEKLPLDLRRQLDWAIVNHQPATYQAIFDKFKLAGFGVSFTAFYRYARRIRTNAALMETAALALPKGAPVEKFLPEIVGERFLEAALDEKTSARTLHRLADTHRIAIQNYHACRRFAVQIEDEERNARIKETDDFLKAANQIAQCQANKNWMQGHIVKSIHAILEPDLAARAPARPPSPRAPDDDPAPIRARTEASGIQTTAAACARIPSRTHAAGNPLPCSDTDPCSPRTHPSLHATSPSPAPSRPPMPDSSFIHLPLTSPGDVKGHPSSFPAITLDPPTPRSHSPTLLSERRRDKRRQRRKERHRRRRPCGAI